MHKRICFSILSKEEFTDNVITLKNYFGKEEIEDFLTGQRKKKDESE